MVKLILEKLHLIGYEIKEAVRKLVFDMKICMMNQYKNEMSQRTKEGIKEFFELDQM